MNSIEHILLQTINYIITTIPVIIVSIFFISLLVHSGYIRRIKWIARPLMKFGRIDESLGIVFITAFASPSAASAMLRSLYDKGLISGKDVIISVMSNAFPVMVMETRSMLPVMISFLGGTGLVIFLILIAARFVQTVIALLIGRFINRNSQRNPGIPEFREEGYRGIALVKRSLAETVDLIKRIVKITIPVTVIIYTLIEAGFFRYLALKIQFLSTLFSIPVEGLGIVAAYFGNYVAAYTMAGTVFSQGLLSQKEIIITMLTAKVLASLFFAARHSTPYYIGIFGSGLGFKITVINTLFRNVIDITTIVLLKFLL